jgi:hypothetical protein
MVEDKLTTDQRIRLECLNQANAHAQGRGDSHDVIKVAKEFEDYIRYDGDGEIIPNA